MSAAPAATLASESMHALVHCGETPADDSAQFADDVLEGLSRPRKAIPSRWLYDARGAQLFDRITRLESHTPTRTETWILERSALQIAAAAGPRATLIELGGRANRNTHILLAALDRPAAYVPINTAAHFDAQRLETLRARFAPLTIAPMIADFSRLTSLPPTADPAAGGRHIVYLPGSAIGDFTPHEAVALLQRIGCSVGRDALLVIGTDTTHDPALLLPTYDDGEGASAAFNKNLLVRINRELDGNFDLAAFDHRARFNVASQCVEMQLVSRCEQKVQVLGQSFHFEPDEPLQTASDYKYGYFKFHSVARHALWAHRQFWPDAHARFALHVLERAS
jgi:dimethylhistidine N-methyltransferase